MQPEKEKPKIEERLQFKLEERIRVEVALERESEKVDQLKFLPLVLLKVVIMLRLNMQS